MLKSQVAGSDGIRQVADGACNRSSMRLSTCPESLTWRHFYTPYSQGQPHRTACEFVAPTGH